MSQRYDQLFSQLKANSEGAFVPFVTIGDPNLELSEKIIRCLIENGADALELGLPFSDPVADGPVIQAANIRALSQPLKIQQCFDLIARIRADYPDLPIGLLVYCNLVVSNGTDQFYQRAKTAGVDSVLIADVPLREGKRFSEAAKTQGIAPIFIAPPDASENTLKQVAEASEGYIYLLSRAGVTGANDTLNAPAEALLSTLRNAGGAPALLGFGIAQPEHVRQAIAAGAAGAISGSAVVKIIENNLEQPKELLEQLGAFIANMKAATRG